MQIVPLPSCLKRRLFAMTAPALRKPKPALAPTPAIADAAANRAITSNMRPRAGEVLGRFNALVKGNNRDDALREATRQMWDKARDAKMTLTGYLESLDPSNEYPTSDPMGQLDAFERQLALAQI